MTQGFVCSRCGEHHPELPMAFHAEAPAYWTPELADEPRSELTSDQCVINGEHFFVRGLLELPVAGLDQPPTLNLKTMLHSRPVGERPWIELEPTDHPLSLEQQHGISQTRLQQIVEAAFHPPS